MPKPESMDQKTWDQVTTIGRKIREMEAKIRDLKAQRQEIITTNAVANFAKKLEEEEG